MISFTVVTSTPVALRDLLLARGIIQQLPEADGAGTYLCGVREGLEWTEVPNIMFTDMGPPPVRDTRRVYLVLFAHAAEEFEAEGEAQDDRSVLLRTKFGKWIMANSVSDPLVSADGRSWPARRIGSTVWVTLSPDFGMWG